MSVTIDELAVSDLSEAVIGARWLSRTIPSSLYGTDDRDQVYAYDGLLRLATFDEGTESGGSISGTPVREEDWTLDALGNWTAFVQKAAGTTTLDQSRSHNDANEVTSIGATTGPDWYEPAQDAAGNLYVFPDPKSPVHASVMFYDAWNRPVSYYAVNVGVNHPVALYEYDGLHRRIVKTVDANGDGTVEEVRHFYYNPQWQVVEERLEVSSTIDADPVNQYVWQPHYVDSLAVRYWDSDATGGPDAYHFYLQDANYNVTAVTDSSGAVVERYAYTPYGVPTILNGASDGDGAEWSVDSNGSDVKNVYLYTGREYDWETGLQINQRRYYASHLGRWLTRDPIEYEADSLNLYEYVASAPTFYIDPSGLRPTAPTRPTNPRPQPPARWPRRQDPNPGLPGLPPTQPGGSPRPYPPSWGQRPWNERILPNPIDDLLARQRWWSQRIPCPETNYDKATSFL